LPLSTILIFDFGIVATVWYFMFFILYLYNGIRALYLAISCYVKHYVIVPS